MSDLSEGFPLDWAQRGVIEWTVDGKAVYAWPIESLQKGSTIGPGDKVTILLEIPVSKTY